MSKRHKSVEWFARSRTLMKRAAELGYQMDVDGIYIVVDNYVTQPHFGTLAEAEAFVDGSTHVYDHEVMVERSQGEPPIDVFADHAKLRDADRERDALRAEGVSDGSAARRAPLVIFKDRQPRTILHEALSKALAAESAARDPDTKFDIGIVVVDIMEAVRAYASNDPSDCDFKGLRIFTPHHAAPLPISWLLDEVTGALGATIAEGVRDAVVDQLDAWVKRSPKANPLVSFYTGPGRQILSMCMGKGACLAVDAKLGACSKARAADALIAEGAPTGAEWCALFAEFSIGVGAEAAAAIRDAIDECLEFANADGTPAAPGVPESPNDGAADAG